LPFATTGEEKPGPMAVFQTGFSSLGKDSIGADPAAGCPSRFGPRHCGQSAAWTAENTRQQTPITREAPTPKLQKALRPWAAASQLAFGDLKFWCLVFGAWCFVTVPLLSFWNPPLTSLHSPAPS